MNAVAVSVAIQRLESLGYVFSLDGEKVRCVYGGTKTPNGIVVRPLLDVIKANRDAAISLLARRGEPNPLCNLFAKVPHPVCLVPEHTPQPTEQPDTVFGDTDRQDGCPGPGWERVPGGWAYLVTGKATELAMATRIPTPYQGVGTILPGNPYGLKG